ncbi:glycine cleavage system protein H [Streptomyces sp. NBC_00237]|uniref:glycine cleavage system protein H n=1 Tax=Streptomyces sp. NBC_00237 TaxID=2975687 RepID=UPI0022532A91|nr:glycine cleavage system H protein [Streptomyces sp. NBC_00237]MCX5205818.1 glycine cleavage system protein H [Streptomyces sp. NBC_00237]
MSNIPKELKYAGGASGEWVRDAGKNEYVVGLTDPEQEQLGDVTSVRPPAIGTQVTAGENCMLVEAVLQARSAKSPLSGEIVAVNDDLTDSPELINDDPYGKGWLFRVKASDPGELSALQDADTYRSHLD